MKVCIINIRYPFLKLDSKKDLNEFFARPLRSNGVGGAWEGSGGFFSHISAALSHTNTHNAISAMMSFLFDA